MVEIKILAFALCTFFQTEDLRIMAETTIVTIDPIEKTVKIILEDPFTIIETNEDIEATKMQYNSIVDWSKTNTNWSNELDHFIKKELNIYNEQPEDDSCNKIFSIKLKYENEKDLETLGIWYNTTKNEFAINNTPDIHLTSDSARSEGNYWYFGVQEPFVYILKPFISLPSDFYDSKKNLNKVLNNL